MNRTAVKTMETPMRSTARREIALSLGCYGVAAIALGAAMWLAAAPLPGSASVALLGPGRAVACHTCAHPGGPVARLAELDR